MLICVSYFFLNYKNFKILNEVDLVHTKNTKHNPKYTYNIDLLRYKSNAEIFSQFYKIPFNNFKNCLISDISKKIHPKNKNHKWQLIKNTEGYTIKLEFNSNNNNNINFSYFEECINIFYNEYGLKLLDDKINYLKLAVDLVENYEKSETQEWKINAVILEYGLPFLNKNLIFDLENLKKDALKEKNTFVTVNDVSSFTVNGLKNQIEILLSILIMVNVLIYSFHIISYPKLNSLKKRIFK